MRVNPYSNKHQVTPTKFTVYFYCVVDMQSYNVGCWLPTNDLAALYQISYSNRTVKQSVKEVSRLSYALPAY